LRHDLYLRLRHQRRDVLSLFDVALGSVLIKEQRRHIDRRQDRPDIGLVPDPLEFPRHVGSRRVAAELGIPRNTFDFDVVGHYARPDIFQLHVDERPKPPVISQ
jgi:hypothetical protein